MRVAALISFIASVAGLKQAVAALQNYTFEQYEVEFNKVYAPEERAMRAAIFYKNLAEAIAQNEASSTASFGVNKFSDMTEQEFSAFVGKARASAPERTVFSVPETHPPVDISKLPKEKNWLNVVSPVKNQAKCGSCWAFAAIENIEAYHTIKTGERLELSTQQLVDCAENPNQCGGIGGCKGSTAEIAYEHVRVSGGVVEEAAYPYKAVQEECRAVPSKKVTVTDWAQLPNNRYDMVMHHLANKGPLSIALSATPLKQYKGGVFTGCAKEVNENVDVNHAVQLVGYGTDEATGLDYWLVRNSWGAQWGEGGYIRIYRDKPHEKNHCLVDSTTSHGSACKGEDWPLVVCGHCGILSEASFPVVGDAAIDGYDADAEAAFFRM